MMQKEESGTGEKQVLYICDGKACGENHECDLCHHTTDIEHAVNFKKEGTIYAEREHL